MCNHFRQAILKGHEIPGWSADQFSDIRIRLKLDLLPTDVYPDREALVMSRNAGGELAPEIMRWGFPPVNGPVVTNVRNVKSAYWRPWLKPEQRCIVPASSFAEYGQTTPKREVWFERPDGATIWFAGIWRPWTGPRGAKSKPIDGEHLLFSFLTCEPNSVVAPVHPKAMPVILREHEIDTWLDAPTDIALQLQRPLPDAELRIAA